MIPATGERLSTISGFPRVSGDDPASAFKPFLTLVFSPRERG